VVLFLRGWYNDKMRKKGERNFSWMNPKLEVRDTEKYGKGVFAKADIKKGDTLVIFGGYIVPFKKESDDSGIQITDNFVLTSLNHTEPTDYINHSCEPNLGIKGQNFLVALRNIKKNEQIAFDYAMCLFSKNKKDYYSFDR
jgi:SET domain-containing protein